MQDGLPDCLHNESLEFKLATLEIASELEQQTTTISLRYLGSIHIGIYRRVYNDESAERM